MSTRARTASEGSDAVDAHKAVMIAIVDIFNSGNVSAVGPLFASEYVDHQRPGWMDVSGPEEFEQIVREARKSLPNLFVNVEDLIVEGDRVVARLQWHSTDEVGKQIHRETIDILRLVDGRVAEHWGAESWSSERQEID